MNTITDNQLFPAVLYDQLKLYGSFSMAYHTLQPSLKHFQTDDGYIAYQTRGHSCIALGNPVCNPNKLSNIISDFIREFPSPTFVQIDQKTSNVLSSYNFKINQFGCEAIIKLPYSLEGGDKSEIRHLNNCGEKNNISVKELSDRSLLKKTDNIFPNGNKYNQEMNEFEFLSRPLVCHDEPGVRIFGGFVNNQLIGYSLFDPIYNNNQIIGYAEAIIRRSTDAPKGSRIYILLESLKKFYSEGINEINLGLVPFTKTEKALKPIWPTSRMTELLFEFTYRYGTRLFNFKGLNFHKSRFRGIQQPVYFATRSSLPIKELTVICKLTTKKNWYDILK